MNRKSAGKDETPGRAGGRDRNAGRAKEERLALLKRVGGTKFNSKDAARHSAAMAAMGGVLKISAQEMENQSQVQDGTALQVAIQTQDVIVLRAVRVAVTECDLRETPVLQAGEFHSVEQLQQAMKQIIVMASRALRVALAEETRGVEASANMTQGQMQLAVAFGKIEAGAGASGGVLADAAMGMYTRGDRELGSDATGSLARQGVISTAALEEAKSCAKKTLLLAAILLETPDVIASNEVVKAIASERISAIQSHHEHGVEVIRAQRELVELRQFHGDNLATLETLRMSRRAAKEAVAQARAVVVAASTRDDGYDDHNDDLDSAKREYKTAKKEVTVAKAGVATSETAVGAMERKIQNLQDAAPKNPTTLEFEVKAITPSLVRARTETEIATAWRRLVVRENRQPMAHFVARMRRGFTHFEEQHGKDCLAGRTVGEALFAQLTLEELKELTDPTHRGGVGLDPFKLERAAFDATVLLDTLSEYYARAKDVPGLTDTYRGNLQKAREWRQMHNLATPGTKARGGREKELRETWSGICRNFAKGSCRHGDSCRFAHTPVAKGAGGQPKGKRESRKRKDPEEGSASNCRNFIKGHCSHGSKCKFKHGSQVRGGNAKPGRRTDNSCHAFADTGTCRFGDACRFDHIKPRSLRPPKNGKSGAAATTRTDSSPGQCYAHMAGRCKYGDKCRFGHTTPQNSGQGKAAKRQKPTQTCQAFMRTGSCRYGDNCKFQHGPPGQFSQTDSKPTSQVALSELRRKVEQSCQAAETAVSAAAAATEVAANVSSSVEAMLLKAEASETQATLQTEGSQLQGVLERPSPAETEAATSFLASWKRGRHN